MERLTERYNDGQHKGIIVKELYGENSLKTFYEKFGDYPVGEYLDCEEGYLAMHKLAEYEDLEEQCIKENAIGLKLLIEKWKEFLEDMHELAEYRKLKQQGKLQILPCAVGDTVWCIFEKNIYEAIVQKVTIVTGHKSYRLTKIEASFQMIDPFYSDGRMVTHGMYENYLERVFLTREEAETALEKMKGEEHE